MIAELLGELAPAVAAGRAAHDKAQRAVDTMKEKNLDAEPSLVVPLNLAHGGDGVSIKPSKVRIGGCSCDESWL